MLRTLVDIFIRMKRDEREIAFVDELLLNVVKLVDRTIGTPPIDTTDMIQTIKVWSIKIVLHLAIDTCHGVTYCLMKVDLRLVLLNLVCNSSSSRATTCCSVMCFFELLKNTFSESH